MKGLVLAMDIGTSSLRTALFSLDGSRHYPTTSQQTYPLRAAHDGAAELSPKALLAAALKALAETFEKQDADRELRDQPILGWGASCFWHSLLGLDAKFAPLTPIYTWADSRCASDAARLRERFNEEEIHARTGCMLRASFWPAKLAWLRRTQKPLTRKVAHWVSPIDFLHTQFCGDLRPSLSMTSASGMLDLAGKSWDADLANAVGHRPTYEPGFAPAEALRISGKFARKFPRLAGTPVLPAIGDGAASNLGSGATLRRVAAINYGTSAALRVVRIGKYRPVPFGIFCYAIDADRWLLGGATSNAGNAYQWATETFRVEGNRQPSEPSKSLVALPFLNGERAPTWCEDLPAVIFGMRQSHTPPDLQRAFIEATYLRLAQIVEPLERAAGVSKLTFVVSGGLSRSGESVHNLVNALGRKCQTSGEPEASLRGAAVFALEKLGHKIAPVKWSSPITPDRKLAALYVRARKRQTILEEGMTELSRRLQDV